MPEIHKAFYEEAQERMEAEKKGIKLEKKGVQKDVYLDAEVLVKIT